MDVKEIIAKAISNAKENNIVPSINIVPIKKPKSKVKKTEIKPLELSDIGIKEVDFSKKGRKEFSTELRENLLDWNNRDFALYIKKKIENKFRPHWGLKFVGVVTYLDSIKDKIQNYLGYCDNIVFKDYLDYYFNKWASFYQKKNEQKLVAINPMNYNSVIESFVSSYNYQDSLKKMSQQKDIIVQHDETIENTKLSGKKIDMAYLLGLNNFLLEYGIILVSNWLQIEKKLDKEYIFKAVEKCISRMNKISIKKVTDITRELSPYPDWFEIKTFPNFEFDIVFTSIDKWNFLKEKDKNGSE